MHHDELDAAAWDRPRADVLPSRVVMICSTPRSGSYLLCRQMIHAGLGIPHEYFRPRTVHALASRWGVTDGDDARYVDELVRRRSAPNGVFCSKLQMHHRAPQFRARENLVARADLVVLLVRRDLVAQAVSLQMSLATGLWSFDATRGPRASDVRVDDVGLALRLADDLQRQNKAWSVQLAPLGSRLIEVDYESFAPAQGALVRRIAESIGLADDAWTPPPPEGRDHRWPEDIEAARVRLLARAREAAAAATGA